MRVWCTLCWVGGGYLLSHDRFFRHCIWIVCDMMMLVAIMLVGSTM